MLPSFKNVYDLIEDQDRYRALGAAIAIEALTNRGRGATFCEVAEAAGDPTYIEINLDVDGVPIGYTSNRKGSRNAC